jgi:cation transport ATPase
MAVWGALGTAARRQIVFQNGEAIERLAAVRAVRFDKTGTLTTGEPEVAHFIADDDTAGPEALRRAGSLAAGSTHILAGAIRRFAPAAATAALIADLHHVAGHGILGRISAETTPTSLGSVQWLRHNGLVMPPSLATARAAAETSGNSLSAIGWAGRVRGLFVFRETVRPQATAALNRCRQLGLDVAVLTGDHPRRAELLSQELGAPTIGGLLPQDKVVAVREAHCALGSVAMVGDGMNDAPALAAADVGVAMGCGADLTRGAASVCLLGNDLMRLPEAIELARLTRRIIRQNLFWAFGFNTAGVALAAAGCLNPVLAAAAMAASSVLVVGNSLRVVTSSRLDTEPAATIAPVPEPTINAAACR